ncbi:MAG: ribosomal protein S18-alanine N-acetyltransferase [Deltaproteobacteria bacterium]|nr:ribosomal protein S18-alanine N-acetyltransferase [Deltaproteobacteria bacterium]
MIIEEFEGKKSIGKIEFNAVSDELEIINIEVPQEFRRQGIATKLFQKMLSSHAQVRSVFLDVRPSNAPALAFYQKMGFKQIRLRPKYYSDGEDAIVMVKKI